MLWPFIIGGIVMALIGVRVKSWIDQVPNSNADFDALSVFGMPDRSTASTTTEPLRQFCSVTAH